MTDEDRELVTAEQERLREAARREVRVEITVPKTLPYDSRPDTWQHINQVQAILAFATRDLIDRALVHDWSKVMPPEVEVFDEFTPRLAESPFGTPGYAENLVAMKPALQHHYALHDHHPEHFGKSLVEDAGGHLLGAGGIFDMNALQLVEMCADWIASSHRAPEARFDAVLANLGKTAERFGYAGTALERTIEQTIRYLLASEDEAK